VTEFIDFTLPAGGFATPVAMWLACHQRLEGVCGLLQRLHGHVKDFGADEAARFGAEGVRRYFSGAARRHQDDEDVDLFPRVLESLSGHRRASLRSTMDRLQDDHAEAERLWQPVDRQLTEIQRGVRISTDENALRALIDKHLSHRRAEEDALLQLVRTTLPPADLTAIGDAMAQRRGLTWARLNGGRL
jgi:hypothetical protein